MSCYSTFQLKSIANRYGGWIFAHRKNFTSHLWLRTSLEWDHNAIAVHFFLVLSSHLPNRLTSCSEMPIESRVAMQEKWVCWVTETSTYNNLMLSGPIQAKPSTCPFHLMILWYNFMVCWLKYPVSWRASQAT
jgi:hypothetical protein